MLEDIITLYVMGDDRVPRSIDQIIETIEQYNNIDCTANKVAIFRGVRVKKTGNTDITYLMAVGDDEIRACRDIKPKTKVRLQKINYTRESYIEFVCWDRLYINNGQINCNNLNMLNDHRKHLIYSIILK